MKENKGITLIALIITVILLAILAGTSTFSAIATINYTQQNMFIAELKIISEKVNIAKKEIAIGSTTYDNVGKNIDSISPQDKINVQKAFLACGVSNVEQEKFKFFDETELKKIGIYDITQNVLINFESSDIISVEGIIINDNTYYTIESVQEVM